MHFTFAGAVGALALFATPITGQAAAGAAAGAGAAQPAAGAGAAQPAAGAAGAGAAQPAGAAGAAAGGGAGAAPAAAAPAAGAPAAGASAAQGVAPPAPSALQSSSPSTGKFPSLTGTWSTKSRTVVTGPGFYDPVNEKFTEPSITGFSYSFTDDGWYEEAYYRAVSNPTTPSCPKGLIQWQHGKYTVNGTGSIMLTPIEIDGRQLNSDPCSYKLASYERYHQKETLLKYEVIMDRFHNVWRLNLYQFNGVPMNPMYLVYQPPQMLPTQTLNPVSSSTATGSSSSSTGSSKKKRSVQLEKTPLGKHALKTAVWMNPEKIWYAGLGMVGLGSFLYLAF